MCSKVHVHRVDPPIVWWCIVFYVHLLSYIQSICLLKCDSSWEEKITGFWTTLKWNNCSHDLWGCQTNMKSNWKFWCEPSPWIFCLNELIIKSKSEVWLFDQPQLVWNRTFESPNYLPRYRIWNQSVVFCLSRGHFRHNQLQVLRQADCYINPSKCQNTWFVTSFFLPQVTLHSKLSWNTMIARPKIISSPVCKVHFFQIKMQIWSLHTLSPCILFLRHSDLTSLFKLKATIQRDSKLISLLDGNKFL